MAKDKIRVQDTAVVTRHLETETKLAHIVCSKCGAEVDVVEYDDSNYSLIEEILSKSVPDRDLDTYLCPKGHDEGLEVG